MAGKLSGHSYTEVDLRWLLARGGSDIVREEPVEEGEPAYRLYHQALVDALRPPDEERRNQRIITSALRESVPERPGGGHDWLAAHPYVRSHLATHAGAASQLDELVADPGFLVATEPSALLRALPSLRTQLGSLAAATFRRAYPHLREKPPPEVAGAYLEMTARQTGADARADGVRALGLPLPWRTKWARWSSDPSLLMGRHAHSVFAMAVGRVGERAVAVSGGADGTVRLWDLKEGGPLGEPLIGHQGPVNAVAVGRMGEPNCRRLRRRRRDGAPVGPRRAAAPRPTAYRT